MTSTCGEVWLGRICTTCIFTVIDLHERVASLRHVINLVIDSHNLSACSRGDLGDQLIGKDFAQVLELQFNSLVNGESDLLLRLRHQP